MVLAVPNRPELVLDWAVRVLGRLDEAIQIAGVNVYPAPIRQLIAVSPLVADCGVYAKADADGSQLYGAGRLRTLTDANRFSALFPGPPQLALNTEASVSPLTGNQMSCPDKSGDFTDTVVSSKKPLPLNWGAAFC